MNRRDFLTRIGFGAAALATGMKPLEAILTWTPAAITPTATSFDAITTAELSRIFHEAYARHVVPALALESPCARLFASLPDASIGKSLIFPVNL